MSDTDIKVYSKEIEDFFLQLFVTDPDLFVRCLNIINDKHFNDEENRKAIYFMKDYADKHSSLPTLEQIEVITGKVIVNLKDYDDHIKDWFLTEYEQFARHKEIEMAIDKAPDLIEESRYGEVEDLIKAAVSTSLVKDLGLDYFADPLGRLDEIANSRGAVSTGWDTLDHKLYGGVNRGEISIFAGQSGAGKSVFLQNMACNWVSMGLNVMYVSLELNQNLCASRIDAMQTGYATTEVLRNREDVDLQLKILKKETQGSLRIVQLKNGCTSNDVKAFVKEYEIQTGIKVDAILLDYLDLFMPTNAKISPENLFVKDKYVTENLRDLAVELDCLMMTASQLNRGSHDADKEMFTHDNIAGGMSKINTADNVFAIRTSADLKEAGRYKLEMLKTRSSSGVGSVIDLAFEKDCLRVRDLLPTEADALTSATQVIMSNVGQSITTGDTGKSTNKKPKSEPTSKVDAVVETADTEEKAKTDTTRSQFADLSSILGKISGTNDDK